MWIMKKKYRPTIKIVRTPGVEFKGQDDEPKLEIPYHTISINGE